MGVPFGWVAVLDSGLLGSVIAIFPNRVALLITGWTVASAISAIPIRAMAPNWTDTAVRTARTGTVLSFGFGVAADVILAFVGYVVIYRWMMLPPALGILVYLVPVVAFGLAGTVVGIIALGAFVTTRFGTESTFLRVVVGAITVIAISFIPIVGWVVVAILITIGIGAAFRVRKGYDVSTQGEQIDPPERMV